MRAGLIRISTIVVAVAFGCDLFDGSRGTSNSKPSPEGAPPQTRPSASAGAHSSPKPHDGKPEWERLADDWDHPDPIPNFELTNQEGKKFRLGELADRHVMVGFIFTNCSVPKACPLTMQKMRAVQRLWGEREKAGETRGRRLHLLSFTFDPENDTPRVLKRYGETHEADFRSWTLATGPAGLMDDGLPSLFGVLAAAERQVSDRPHRESRSARSRSRQYRGMAGQRLRARACRRARTGQGEATAGSVARATSAGRRCVRFAERRK